MLIQDLQEACRYFYASNDQTSRVLSYRYPDTLTLWTHPGPHGLDSSPLPPPSTSFVPAYHLSSLDPSCRLTYLVCLDLIHVRKVKAWDLIQCQKKVVFNVWKEKENERGEQVVPVYRDQEWSPHWFVFGLKTKGYQTIIG